MTRSKVLNFKSVLRLISIYAIVITGKHFLLLTKGDLKC
jgi:hypothetical protein